MPTERELSTSKRTRTSVRLSELPSSSVNRLPTERKPTTSKRKRASGTRISNAEKGRKMKAELRKKTGEPFQGPPPASDFQFGKQSGTPLPTYRSVENQVPSDLEYGSILSDEDFKSLDTRWSNISDHEIDTMSDDQFYIFRVYEEAVRLRKVGEENSIYLSPDESRLAGKQLKEIQRRQLIEDKEMKKYFRKNLFDEKSFHDDIQRYDSLYVFCVSFAKLESPTYKDFMESLANDHDNYKVYFAPNKALAYSVGLVEELTAEQHLLKLGDIGYTTKEFDTGLHRIGIMLDNDNYGVLLTNKTEDEVLSKFREYRELDFINAGSRPMDTLVFEKNEIVMPLPPLTSARELCPKLKMLGMPVELSGQDLKLTERFVVCEIKKRVTEKAAKILVLVGRKMFDFVLLPVGYWSRTTKEAKYFPMDLPIRE